MTPFTQHIIHIVGSIPKGRVASYGQIAALAGNPRAARQVARILHSCAVKYALPWQRVVNAQGKISLKNDSFEKQYRLLQQEGIVFGLGYSIDLNKYGFIE